MNSNEVSWLDLIKEHKWKIVVIAICLFAGVSYFSMGNQPVEDARSTPTNSAAPFYATPTAQPTATASSAPIATSSPKPTGGPALSIGNSTQAPQAPTPSDWRPTANSFATAWANPKVGQEAWLSAIKPTVTPDLYAKFSNTDVERMSQLEVSGINAEQEDYAGVNARVSFKGTNFTILIHLTPQANMGWLVSVVTSY